MSETAVAQDDVLLTCTPGREGERLVFDYAVANQSAGAVYVLDVLPANDARTGQAVVDSESVSVWLEPDGILHISKGVPPMPEGRDPQTRIVPLAVKLGPGERLVRRLSHPLPLAEHNPYVPCGHLRDYRLRPIQGIALGVDIIPADAPGFAAVRAVGYPSTYVRLAPEEDVLLLRRLVCAFRTRGLHALVHTGDFPRP